MPELPEVEQVVRSLASELVGLQITDLEVRHPAVLHRPAGDVDAFRRGLVGRTILAVRRRGKYIVIDLDQGHLICHLRMTGRLLLQAAEETAGRHRHWLAALSDGRYLVYDDVRRFGGFFLVDEDREALAALGVEPLDPAWRAEDLYRALKRRHLPIKSFLMDQKEIAGIGNIYADEALFRAGIRPRKSSDRLTRREATALHEALQRVLTEAIAMGGSTIRDYVDGHGEAGGFQTQHQVYGLGGQPCKVCQHTLKSIKIGGRTTVYCPHCQKS